LAKSLWARGYAKQALSDLEAREILVSGNAEKCHRLHFLQMASEKVCKAYLTMANGHENVRKTHAYVARNLPIDKSRTIIRLIRLIRTASESYLK
jgi:hypothetical protein